MNVTGILGDGEIVGTVDVQGNVASGAADSGNPVKVGGVAYTAAEQAASTGQRTNLATNPNGALYIAGYSDGSSGADARTNIAYMGWRSSASFNGQALPLAIASLAFNGTTWDRQRSKVPAVLLASAARTTTQVSADIPTYNLKGITAIVDVTSAGTGSITLTIDGKDANGIYYNILTGAAIITNSTNVYRLFRGATAALNATVNDILPATIRITITANNANTMTYSASYVLFD